MEYLNEYKKNILKYLLESKEEIKIFELNTPIKLNKKWNLILNYPDKLHRLKISTTTRSTIISTITDILLDNLCTSIHPILFIIFHYELREYIKYNVTCPDDKPIQLYLTSKDKQKIKELQPQINASFKIYWKLITDKQIQSFANYYCDNDLVQEIINSLYYQVSVEELINLNSTIIETNKIKFNDLCFCLDIDDKILEKYMKNYEKYKKNRDNLSDRYQQFQNKILIEINKSNNINSIDFIRKTTIYEFTGKTVIDYNIIDDDIKIIYYKLLKEISKLIYKNYDTELGIIFYLTNIENIDIRIATFFLDIYNSTKNKRGISMKTILSIFTEWEYTDKKNFIKLIKTELDNDEYFIEENEDYKKSLLSSLGVDKLIFLPRKSDFIECDQMIQFVKMYNKFREGFFNTIENLLNNEDENDIIIYLLKKLIYKEEYEKFKQPLIDAFLEKILNEDVKLTVENKFKIELDSYLPIFKKTKSKYDNIDKNIIKKSFSEKVSDIIDKKYDNTKSKIKKRVFIPKDVIDFIIKNY